MQPPMPQRFMKTNRPAPLGKNEPNQTQFAQSQNAPKSLSRKALWKSLPPPSPAKQSQSNPRFFLPIPNATGHAHSTFHDVLLVPHFVSPATAVSFRPERCEASRSGDT